MRSVSFFRFSFLALAVLVFLEKEAWGFQLCSQRTSASRLGQVSCLQSFPGNANDVEQSESLSRRALLQSLVVSPSVVAFLGSQQQPAMAAAERPSLESNLYRILRVREATFQETRLIKSGKFKDMQRANVKLAVKFMIENYKLNDAFVASSAFLESNDRRVRAVDVGSTAVQNLFTILEYFDSSDVENIKVGASSLSGKEGLVLKGLDATRKSIDEFLSFFPESAVASVKEQIKKENELNIQEFDPSLGDIVNLPPPS